MERCEFSLGILAVVWLKFKDSTAATIVARTADLAIGTLSRYCWAGGHNDSIDDDGFRVISATATDALLTRHFRGSCMCLLYRFLLDAQYSLGENKSSSMRRSNKKKKGGDVAT